MQTLDKVVCVNLDIHLYTGRRKLRLEDLKAVSNEQIPPDTLASLGAKKVCNPKDLDPLERLKRRAERACEEVGMRFLRGGIYLVARDDAPGLQERLDRIMAEGTAACEAFVANYEQRTEQWMALNPAWAGMIRRALTPVAVVRSRLHFGYQIFEIANPADGTLARSGLESVVGGLGEQLFREIAAPARRLWEGSLQNRRDVTRRTVGALRRLLRKLRGLASVDARISPLVTWAEDALDVLPGNGRITGNDLKTLESIVFILSDPDKTVQMAESLLYGTVGPQDGESVSPPAGDPDTPGGGSGTEPAAPLQVVPDEDPDAAAAGATRQEPPPRAGNWFF